MSQWLRGNILIATLIYVILVSANALWIMYIPLYFSRSISAEFLGYIFSLEIILRIAASVAGGRIADRRGRKKAIIIGYFICTLSIALILVIPSMSIAVIGYLIYWIGIGIERPGFSMLLMESSPKEKRGIAYMFVTRIAPSIPPAGLAIVGGYLFDLGLYRISLLIGVICFALSTLMCNAYLKETLQEAREPGLSPSLLLAPKSLNSLFRDKLLFGLMIAFGLDALSAAGIGWYISLYLAALGYKALEYGVMISTSTLVIALGAFISGRLVDSLGPFKTLVIGWLSAAVMAILFGSAPPYASLLVIYSAWALVEMMGAAAPPVLISDAYRESERATKLALINFSTGLLSIAGPVSTSLALSVTPNMPFLLRAALLAASIATLSAYRKTLRRLPTPHRVQFPTSLKGDQGQLNASHPHADEWASAPRQDSRS